MVWMLAALVIGLAIAYLVWRDCEHPEEQFDPEEVMRFRLDQHRIRRRLDTRLTKHEQRVEAERVKRELAEALDDDER